MGPAEDNAEAGHLNDDDNMDKDIHSDAAETLSTTDTVSFKVEWIGWASYEALRNLLSRLTETRLDDESFLASSKGNGLGAASICCFQKATCFTMTMSGILR